MIYRTSSDQFERYLAEPEGLCIEFKEARNRFGFDDLMQYCVAIANEGGGLVILGVTDRRPRQVTGTQAFEEPGRTEAGLHQNLGHRIPVEELTYQEKRVLIIHVPSRLPGCAWNYKGRYLKRAGDELTGYGDQELKNIFAETGPDFTSEPVPDATLADLDPAAVAEFKIRWQKKNPSLRLTSLPDTQVLTDADLLVDGRPNYAALILLGKERSISRHLAQAEVIFEYRSGESAGPAADREEFRKPFLLYHDDLWQKINLRNDRQSYQDDFFRYEIPTFDEGSIREAILNAICHRDYRVGGSVFIRQYARRLEIVSPGGFPAGITAENIADQQNPRNRRLAEALNKCGFIERSGQGVNLMIEQAVRQTKPLPDFSQSAAHEVSLTLNGTVQNPAFLRYIERLGEDALSRFQTLDFLVLDALSRDQAPTEEMKPRLTGLIEIGAVETQGRGRGIRYYLSRQLYEEMGTPGSHTRKKGLDHETNKALLLKHLAASPDQAAPMRELEQVLPAQSRRAILRMLGELRGESTIRLIGKGPAQKWQLLRQIPDSGA